MFFCFKQKTAYEIRISDWISDVCSSDLLLANPRYCDQIAFIFSIPTQIFVSGAVMSGRGDESDDPSEEARLESHSRSSSSSDERPHAHGHAQPHVSGYVDAIETILADLIATGPSPIEQTGRAHV